MAKIRLGFISNSSSSSFILNKKCLNKLQINMIKYHIQAASLVGYREEYIFNEFDEWNISEKEDTIEGYTGMNNFDMKRFLELINIPSEAIIEFD